MWFISKAKGIGLMGQARKFVKKTGLSLGLAAAIFAAALSVASAEESRRTPPASGDVTLRVKAVFTPVAYITVSHEPIKLADILRMTEAGDAVTRQSFVSVRGGLPGETVYMTCGVERRFDGEMVRSRGCDGGNDITPVAIIAGHSGGSNIYLTDDLLPDPEGRTSSSISIDITYI
jgi:hypothetical protein